MPEKWRKQQACQRCRDFKVRCEYESMDSRRCNRCLKAGKECVTVQLPTPTSGAGVPKVAKRKRKPSGTATATATPGGTATNKNNGTVASSGFVDYEESIKSGSSLHSPQTREDRINELSQVIREARLEIDLLRKQLDDDKVVSECIQRAQQQQPGPNKECRESRDISYVPMALREEYKELTSELVAPSLRRRDVVQAAIDMGLYTYQECQEYYDEFARSSALFCPYSLYPWRPFEEAVEELPLLTLVIITTIAAGKKRLRIERLCFSERMINERIVMDGQMNTEAIKVLLISMCYFGPQAVPKHPITVFYALGVCLTLDMGCDEDIRIIKNNANECPELVSETADRIRVYMGLCVCFSAMAINTSKETFVKMLPNIAATCEAIEILGLQEDRRVTTMFKMLQATQDALATLADDSRMPITAAQAYYSSALSKLSDLYSILQTLMSGVTFEGIPAGSELILYPMRSFYDMLVVNVAETMMNRILINYTPGDNQMYLIYAQDIYSITAKVVDNFVEISGWNFRFPKYVYFRPLQAIAAMLRLKLVTDSLGIVMNIDVQTYYERIKKVWKSGETEILNLDVGNMLERVERWMYLRVRLNKERALSAGTPDGSASLAMKTTDMMHDLLRQVVGTTSRQRNQPLGAFKTSSDLFSWSSKMSGQSQDGRREQGTDLLDHQQQQQPLPPQQPQFQSDYALIDAPPPPYGYEPMSLGLDSIAVEDPAMGNDIEFLLKELFADVGVRIQM